MNAPQLENKKGFTIIEVVLVLAIAALIFLMVFIALPALQRNQRDTARKTILGKVTSGITTYQSNKRGAQPPDAEALSKYVDAKAQTSGGATTYVIDSEYEVELTNTLPTNGVGNAATDVVQVITGATCNDAGDAAIDGTTRQAAVILQMENADAFFCQST